MGAGSVVILCDRAGAETATQVTCCAQAQVSCKLMLGSDGCMSCLPRAVRCHLSTSKAAESRPAGARCAMPFAAALCAEGVSECSLLGVPAWL